MIIDLASVPIKTGSAYPIPFQSQVAGRTKQKVGAAAGLTHFGVNWVTLAPGATSALRHWHEQQDEFIYIASGTATLITDDGAHAMTAGMMAGFPAGEAKGHHLVNRSDRPVIYLEIGDRTTPERVHYPDDNLVGTSDRGQWQFFDKAGNPYPNSP